VSRLHDSPLGAELDAAREEGSDDAISLVVRRRTLVRVTRLPDAAVSARELAFRQAMADLFGDRGIEGG